ncbi:MAG: SAM-dependent methyltransferase [Candidatus Kerfeldbacteria bacterium CG15_BIG_FIL_POST_REV_8_21_14_020_45_12]|uniref:site-specific DNA-methyltransferase (adenine-specific) n=1 Tax=Candidatus Kerfeldbacteria bacterium CG15_BIG_FIL_POST_REV_8_21_14_020_45_12 TaxID=2014247 RepID=A0A2M7H5A5_9BACT|nr:MAG: SAM-dependent methyltransferase [Candidatus Kerfeldbacteria bacterium CG15_BIG_FIL_POST_REV_8_21_14_020_45_12]PJA93712.1 MAG: SAM-dependent methyltransferase [Candidatus Kerfeldbacteria bacterium CG_4_9_14_3_um_filter_45_8]
MVEQTFTKKTKQLIDNLKGICSDYGLGNSGDEFKIITQVFLYKFMNDKFGYEVKQLDTKLQSADNWEDSIKSYSDDEYELLLSKMSPDSARLFPDHFISTLWKKQNNEQFSQLFSDTLRDVAKQNNDVFSVKTEEGQKIQLFDGVDGYLRNLSESKKDDFAKAMINQLVDVNFEDIFEQKFDFFATIFEYLIKDYNKDGGGVYAEYYTPHAIAKIMSAILVDKPVSNVTVYDPSAGSGTLLMNVAHAIGEDKCTIYSQDLSDKSSHLLRLNLILNNLVHSIHNIIQGNTIKDPYHKQGKDLMKFDYIVSNPPFKLDFSGWSEDIDTKENSERFFAGIPNVPKKKKESMAIYLLFIQHIIYSLSSKGKAAIVVPTGFITAQSGIEKKIRQALIENKMLKGVVSMPSNIFATTGTNVSVVFIDRESSDEKVVLMDASKLGTIVKEGKNQKTVLSPEEEQKIIDAFNKKESIEDLSVVVSYDEIKEKNYSFSAGQYFAIKIEYTDITKEEFAEKMKGFDENLSTYFKESKELEGEIFQNLNRLKYE